VSQVKWNAENAIDYYYQHPSELGAPAAGKKGDNSKISKIFDKYADAKDKDICAGEPLGQFFKDIGVDPEKEAAVTLVCAYKLKCKVLGEIKRKEFVDNFAEMGLDDISKMKNEVSVWKNLLKDKALFKPFYRWLFDFLKEEPERKNIDLDAAIEMLNTVMPPHFVYCKEWVTFLKTKKDKTMTSDVWNMTLDFAFEIKPDFSNYEQETYWPTFFDEFVVYVKANKDAAKAGTASAKDNKSDGKK